MGEPFRKMSGKRYPQAGEARGGRKSRSKDIATSVPAETASQYGFSRDTPVRETSKSDAIRAIAREMVLRGQPPRPKEIVAALRKLGITVLSSQVSTALRDTAFALRQLRVDWERPPVLFPEPTLAFGQVSIDDVIKAKAFVADVGTIEKAMAALVALKQFGGESSEKIGQDRPTVLLGRKPTSKTVDEPASPDQ